MKKALIASLILLMLGGGGAAYYFLVMKKDSTPPEKTEEPIEDVAQQSESDLVPIVDLKPEPDQTEFYVLDRKLEVLEQPEIDGLITDYLYKGEKVEVLEKLRHLVNTIRPLTNHIAPVTAKCPESFSSVIWKKTRR